MKAHLVYCEECDENVDKHEHDFNHEDLEWRKNADVDRKELEEWMTVQQSAAIAGIKHYEIFQDKRGKSFG